MAQPTNPLIVWASDDVILPNAKRPNKSLPSESLIQTGWDLSQKPAADEWNYLLNNNGQYIKWLIEEKINEFLKKSQNLNDLDNKTTARTNLDVFSTSEVNSKQVNTGEGLSGGGDLSVNRTISLDSVTSKISVLTGTILNGETIPLPAGYTEEQCKWLVSIADDNNSNRGWDIDENASRLHYKQVCSTAGRVVTVQSYAYPAGWTPGTANYIIIGVK